MSDDTIVRTIDEVRQLLAEAGIVITEDDLLVPFTREGNTIITNVPDPVEGKYLLQLNILNAAFKDYHEMFAQTGLTQFWYGYSWCWRIAVIG